MNKTQFVEILNNPDLTSVQTLSEIKEIIDEYPFFQTGRMLLLKNLHKLNNIRYNSELKHSAVYIADRNRLYSLINNLPIQNEESKSLLNANKNNNDTQKEYSGKDTQAAITITDNYLNADDEILSDDNNIYNFSTKEKDKEPTEINDYELQNIILPAADLLDYEISTSTGYSLPKLHEVEDLDCDDNRSFSSWLHVMRYSSSMDKQENSKESTRGMNLINDFLNSKPQNIASPSPNIKEIDLSENKTSVQEDILSETLADIYIKQGHKIKAISILEKLLLKYPEKNVYFARRISDLKEN